jgi:hypothetical protein
MKWQITKKIIFDFTLDSSEAIMFTKGGRHEKVFIKENCYDDEDRFFPNISEFDEIIIRFQLERNDKGRFDFITGEAEKHKESVKNES